MNGEKRLQSPDAKIRSLQKRVSDLENLRTELEKKEHHNRILADLSRQLNGCSSALDAARIIVRAAQNMIGWDACFLALCSDSPERIIPVLNIDIINGEKKEVPCNVTQEAGPVVQRALRRGPQLVFRKDDNMNLEAVPFGDLERPSRSLMFAPVIQGQKMIGVLSIQSYDPEAYSEESLEILSSLSDYCGSALERIQAQEKLQRTIRGTIQAISKIVEMRDPYTAGHQHRVASLACAIAREMSLSSERIDAIHMSSVIHDIGKIYVPTEILSTPRQLNKTEFYILKAHPQVGYDILKSIEFPWPVAKIVLQHHERMDGSGYPLGIRGKDILLEARILGVADVMEAMTNHRPYRPGLPLDSALEEMRRNRGTGYDPEVVDVCLDLFVNREFAFQPDHERKFN